MIELILLMDQVILLASLGFITSFLIFFLLKSKSSSLPPSPASLPIIGHLHLLGKLPHQSLQKLAIRYGDYMFLKLGKVSTLVVSSVRGAQEVLRSQDHLWITRPETTFGSLLGYNGAGLAFSNGEQWKHTRKLCALELLSSKRVEEFQPVRKHEMKVLMRELVEHSREERAVDLSTELSDLTFNVISRIIMGKSYSSGSGTEAEAVETRAFKENLDEAAILAGLHSGDYLPIIPKWMDRQIAKIRKLHRKLDEFMQKVVVQHRDSRGAGEKDFIDILVANGASDTTIKALIIDMVGGGTESSAVTVIWALAELLKNQKLIARAQQELKEVVGLDRTLDESDIPKLPYLQAVVKETFRLHPPGPLLIPHESTQETRVGGKYTVPGKTRLVVNIYAIGRDETIWREPLKFDPERFLGDGSSVDVKGQHFELLPFSAGRRICPGTALGLATVQMILGSLLHAFDWKMPHGQSVEELNMNEAFGLTVPRESPLVLIPSPRLLPEAY